MSARAIAADRGGVISVERHVTRGRCRTEAILRVRRGVPEGRRAQHRSGGERPSVRDVVVMAEVDELSACGKLTGSELAQSGRLPDSPINTLGRAFQGM